MIRIFFTSLFLIGCQYIFAQTCCSGGVPLSNNLGLPNIGKGSLISQFGNENFSETSGLGDAVFLAKYTIADILGARTSLNLGLGTKAPLGKSDLTTTQGFQLTADLQPGSSAWDLLGWISVSKGLGFRPSATLSSSFTYRATGKNNSYLNNTSVYEFGNVIQTNVGYTDQFMAFSTIFSPGLVLKYRKALADQINSSEVPNTGGEWMFLRPEMVVNITFPLH